MANIRTASFSRLDDYGKCPKMARFKYVDKVPELAREGEDARDRGLRLHKAEEDYLTGIIDDLPSELEVLREILEPLRTKYQEQPGSVLVEERWNFNDAWEPVADNDWDNIWLIAKLDIFEFEDESEGTAYDLKSGKKNGNEVKHAIQGQLYAVASFFRFLELERVNVRFLYPDVRETSEQSFERKDAHRLMGMFNKRIVTMLSDTVFLPRPSKHTCRFCPYKTGKVGKLQNGTGHCQLNPE